MVATGVPPSVGGLPVIPVPGGFIEFFGYPAITHLTFHPPPGEVELAYTLEGRQEGVLRVTSTNPEFPVTLGVDGQLTVAGDASVGGKLWVKGSIDPTDLQLTPQKRNPVSPVAHGIWVSDGTAPGTVKGGLYYERAGQRIRLDA